MRLLGVGVILFELMLLLFSLLSLVMVVVGREAGWIEEGR
jgi:hypothetical protein